MSVILPLGEFSPDLPSYNNGGMTKVRNVVPLTPKSYGPLPSLQPFAGNLSTAPIPPLPETPYGLFSFLDRNGAETIFAGSATKLWAFRTGDSAFRDVSGVTSHYTVDDADIAEGGTGYLAGDVVNLTWPTGGIPAQFQVDSVGPDLFHASTATIPAGGTAYVAGDILTVVGGTFSTATTITVDNVDVDGVIIDAHFFVNGDYSVTPSNPVSVTGGAGTGATIDIEWLTDPSSGEVLSFHILSGGDYTSQPNSPCDTIGGSGDGATFNTTVIVTSSDATTYHANAYDPWTFVSFGNSIIASTGNDPPQCMNLDTESQFRDLNSDRAPFAKYACVARNFLVFANLTECFDGVTYPQRLHWSALSDGSTWPDLGTDDAAQLQSDATDLRSDLGHITGIASNLQNADIIVLLTNGVFAGRYVGSPVIFDLQVAQGAVGCAVPRSLVVNRGYAYYLGADGWVAFDGITPAAIGSNKIDKTFWTDPDDGVDPNYLYLTQGTADPTGRIIIWAYCGPNSNGVPNRLLLYNWAINQWSFARLDVAWLGKGLTTGFSIEQLSSPPFGNVDELTPSLDDPLWQGGKPYLLVFDVDNQVSTFSGPNLTATVETSEGQPTPGKRSRVTSARPIVDGGVPIVTVGSRDRPEDPVIYDQPVTINVYGEAAIRVDARYLRGRIEIPAGSIWKHILGIEISFAPSTYR